MQNNRTKNIAIPIVNGKPCPRFCHAACFMVASLAGESIGRINFVEVPPCKTDLWPDWLAKFQITDVIACAMKPEIRVLLEKNHINIEDWPSEEEPLRVIHHFLDNYEAELF
jgi:hypothetical protein